MLRLHLPPNLTAAAARDAVPLRVEVDLRTPPPPEILPALALLQRWCGPGAPPQFIQVTRSQLRELAAAAGAQPVFMEAGRATGWRHAALVAEPGPGLPSAGTGPRPSRQPAAAAPPPLEIDGSEHFLAITLPSREHPSYATALALLKESGFTLEPSNRKWWLRDRHKTLNFLAAHLARLRTEFGARCTANFERHTAHLRPVEIATRVDPAGSDFSVTLALEAGTAGDAALQAAVATSRGYVEADRRVYLLDPATLRQFTAAQRALAGDPAASLVPRRTQRISAARAAEAGEILEALSPGFQPPEAWLARSAALRQISALVPAPVPPPLADTLRPYQRVGVAWLWHLHRHGLGGILADEMGLGKTLQALALLSALRAESKGESVGSKVVNGPGPATHSLSVNLQTSPSRTAGRATSLVTCPASLLENWRREAARFAPQLRTYVHHADRRLAGPAEFTDYDLVITSYGTLARDQALFSAVEFAVVIADEAQHLKNRRSQNAAALRALRACTRFLLTGTPLENSLDDLRSLLEFLLPGYLAKLPAGLRGEERAWYDDRLRAQAAPYILRRTKRAVAPELPARLEQVVWCELTPAQERLYRETQERSERELLDLQAAGASDAKLKFATLTQLLRLRQICCDPRLVTARSDGPAPPPALGADPRPEGESSASSPVSYPDSTKLNAFSELLAEAVDDGHRVLVFSQFTSLLSLLRAELEAQGLACCYLDGSMPARARQAEVDRFQASPDIPLFLLSLKAGGTGLNLTGADTVVHFDPWWNPAAEAQATDRAHRIGQTRTVTAYKLIASGTVEEKVLALQDEKRALLAGVFEASDAAAAKLSLAELRSLLQ